MPDISQSRRVVDNGADRASPCNSCIGVIPSIPPIGIMNLFCIMPKAVMGKSKKKE